MVLHIVHGAFNMHNKKPSFKYVEEREADRKREKQNQTDRWNENKKNHTQNQKDTNRKCITLQCICDNLIVTVNCVVRHFHFHCDALAFKRTFHSHFFALSERMPDERIENRGQHANDATDNLIENPQIDFN